MARRMAVTLAVLALLGTVLASCGRGNDAPIAIGVRTANDHSSFYIADKLGHYANAEMAAARRGLGYIRTVVLTGRPGRVRACFHMDIPRQRREHLAQLVAWEERIEREMTSVKVDEAAMRQPRRPV